ncbi:MAG: hypothetical protein ACI3WQ_03955 [Faecousia sp.]
MRKHYANRTGCASDPRPYVAGAAGESAVHGAISVGNVYNLKLLGGASDYPGDYLYRSGSLRWDVESGLWGILRIRMCTLFYHCASCCRNVGQWWEEVWKKA